jgi:hypothetical protein
MGNFYENNIQMGRYDADYGMVLLNQGGGRFSCSLLNGVVVRGQVRRMKKLRLGKQETFVLAQNNDSARVIQFQSFQKKQ